MPNRRRVARSLEEIAALLEFSGAPRFKVKAYRRAAQIVDTLGDELGALVEQARLQDVPGIGPALSQQIQELWASGNSELLSRLRRDHPEGAHELVQVEGLTPRRIRALHAALGIRSVEELKAACVAERVRTVPGFGAKTEARLLAAAERWLSRGETEPPPLLLPAALEIADLLEKELSGVVAETRLAGALRRGEETLRELELVVVGDVDRALAELSELRQVLRVDAEERVAHLSQGVRVQLHAAAAGNLGSALFLRTGNAAHVQAVEARAALRGVSPRAPFADETELYRAAGLAFVPPELRTGGDELERAAREGFGDLLEPSDIQGMVHCHTSYSDGKNSIAEMAEAAHALGMKYITITDHSPSAHYAGGVSLDRLKEQWDEIASAQERTPIRILRGTESDILEDGSLDFPDAVLEQFDVVIASIHARHRMDRARMTERLVRALSLPIFKIWGHALGRILNHREPFECDVPAVLDALVRAPSAIEINADPHRLDLPPEWIPEARARGIPFVVSVDAHSTRGLRVLRYGVTMARRGGVRKQEVLNTAAADAFAARVRPV